VNSTSRRKAALAVALALAAVIAIPGSARADLDKGGDPDQGQDLSRRVEAHLRMAAPRSAVDQRAKLAAAETKANKIPGSEGTWSAFGSDPLLDNVKDYTPIDAIPTMSGRVQDFAVDPGNANRLFAAFGNGGIWETRDNGDHWSSIGDSLPNPFAGAVAFTPAKGGSILDGTGDSGLGYLGLGVYRSTDDGKTWTHSGGVPDGAITYRLAVDPTNNSVIYAATTKGLFRSSDAGANFTNVNLPTGKTDPNGPDCAGNTTSYQCVYNNWVTDVIVRPGTGAVLAAVGWYRGDHVTAAGWNNSVGNGLYRSTNGLPGTFTYVDASSNGFTSPRSHIGNIALSDAAGPNQNHDVVWAIVQDAQAANGEFPVVDPPDGVPAACGTAPCYNTMLDNIYVSTDFGSTWTKKLLDAHQLQACGTTGTDQCGVITAPFIGSYGPGVQAFYNLHIRVDPTQQDPTGVPTRVAFGLEEIWEITNANAPGIVSPHVIGRYFGDPYCPLTAVGPNPPACAGVPAAPTTTHPDQHAAIYVPDGSGGVTLFVGNDGGVFRQHVTSTTAFSNSGWGAGNNVGLHTLLPYQAVMAKDGVVYSGMQDNGEMKVLPDGRQISVFGGDGGVSAVDPNNSNTVYEEYVNGDISVSTDGGHNWTDINPGDTSPQFIVPFVMDPLDPNHLLTGGEDIEETTSGPSTTSAFLTGTPVFSTDWTQVFDLGTGTGDVSHAMTASDLRGDSAYAGFCGACYIPSTAAYGFENGIATNVAGDKPANKMTGDGWHFAKHANLPEREITSLKMDAENDHTIYVALGDYDAAFRPPGALGDDTSKLGHTHVWKSTDAGETFIDISGNLPDAPAYSLAQRGNQLVVGTAVGAFISSDLNGSQWALLGPATGAGALPAVLVNSLQLSPKGDNTMLASTYGRGLQLYKFNGDPIPEGSGAGGPKGVLPATGATPTAALIGVLLLLLAVSGRLVVRTARR
jgi:hypothetical protein